MALAILPDLGLDRRKVSDMTDPATRRKLSVAAIVAFFAIAEKWQLKNDAAMALLGGVSSGKYYELKKSQKGILTQDELTRVSLLIGIFKALNILFSRKLADQWISRPNTYPMFASQPPINALIQGGVPAMLGVRRLLDSRRGGR
jgi:uncharacterized protein (DUF2384 family)